MQLLLNVLSQDLSKLVMRQLLIEISNSGSRSPVDVLLIKILTTSCNGSL